MYIVDSEVSNLRIEFPEASFIEHTDGIQAVAEDATATVNYIDVLEDSKILLGRKYQTIIMSFEGKGFEIDSGFDIESYQESGTKLIVKEVIPGKYSFEMFRGIDAGTNDHFPMKGVAMIDTGFPIILIPVEDLYSDSAKDADMSEDDYRAMIRKNSNTISVFSYIIYNNGVKGYLKYSKDGNFIDKYVNYLLISNFGLNPSLTPEQYLDEAVIRTLPKIGNINIPEALLSKETLRFLGLNVGAVENLFVQGKSLLNNDMSKLKDNFKKYEDLSSDDMFKISSGFKMKHLLKYKESFLDDLNLEDPTIKFQDDTIFKSLAVINRMITLEEATHITEIKANMIKDV